MANPNAGQSPRRSSAVDDMEQILPVVPSTAARQPSSSSEIELADLPPSKPESKSSSDQEISATTSQGPVELEREFPKLSTFRKIFIPILCMSGPFLQTSSSIGIAVGIRMVGEDLQIPEYQWQWLQSSVTLAYACTLLLFGRCADIWGHKVFFVCGLMMAAIFNMAAGLAQTSVQIFIFRAFTGAMFACVVPASIGLLASLFPPGPSKSLAFACFAAGAPIGNAVALVIAGLLIKFVPPGWRSFFYVLAGITGAAGLAGFFLIPGPLLPHRKVKGAAVDVVGAFLATSGLVLFVFALADGEGAAQGWKTPYIPACLVVGALLLAVFFRWESHLEKNGKIPPLMRVSLWKKGKFAVLQSIALCLFGCVPTTTFWINLYWQNYEEIPILQLTARFVPLTIMGLTVTFVGAYMVSRVSGQIILLIGISGSALAALLFALNDPNATYWSYQFVATIFLIWGADAIMLCGTLYVSKIVSPQDQAQGGSIFATMTQLSTSLMLAISTSVSDSVQRKEAGKLGVIIHGNQDTETVVPKLALLKGYKAAYWTTFSFMVLAGLLTTVFLRDMGKVGAKKGKQVVKNGGSNKDQLEV